MSGTIVIAPEGQKPKELGSGSYFSLPGGMKHTTSCKAGAECVIYSQWLGAFDLKPVEGAEKKYRMNGLGAFVGGTASGWVVDHFTANGVKDWQSIWLTFAAYALVLGEGPCPSSPGRAGT